MSIVVALALVLAQEPATTRVEFVLQDGPRSFGDAPTALGDSGRLFAIASRSVLQVWDLRAATKVHERPLLERVQELEFWGERFLIVRAWESVHVLDLVEPGSRFEAARVEFDSDEPLDVDGSRAEGCSARGVRRPDGTRVTVVSGPGGEDHELAAPGECIALGPRGRRCAVVAQEGRRVVVRLFDVGAVQRPRVASVEGVLVRGREPRFSADGRWLAVAFHLSGESARDGADRGLRVYRTDDLRLVAELPCSFPVPSFAFRPGEPLLDVYRYETNVGGRFEAWRFLDGPGAVEPWTLPELGRGSDDVRSIHGAMVDGTAVVPVDGAGRYSGYGFLVVDLARRREAWRVVPPLAADTARDDARTLVDRATGGLVLVDGRGDVFRWDLARGELVHVSDGGSWAGPLVAVDAGRLVWTADLPTVDPDDARERLELSALLDATGIGSWIPPRAIDFAPSRGEVVLAGPSGVAVVRRGPDPGGRVERADRGPSAERHVDRVLSLDPAPLFVVVAPEGALELWHVDGPRLVERVERPDLAERPYDDPWRGWSKGAQGGPRSEVDDLAYCPATATLYVAYTGGLEALPVDADGLGSDPRVLHEGRVGAVAVTRDGSRLAFRTADGIVLRDAGGAVVAELDEPVPSWFWLGFAEGDSLLAARSLPGTALFAADDGARIGRLVAGPVDVRRGEPSADHLIRAGEHHKATRAGARLLAASLGTHPIPATTVDAEHNRPSAVLEALGRAEPATLERWRAVEAARAQRLGARPFERTGRLAPVLREPPPRFVDAHRVELELEVAPWATGVRARVDGVPVTPPGGRPVTDDERAAGVARIAVGLHEGPNTIELEVLDEAGRATLPAHHRCHVVGAEERVPATWFLGVGVSRYADGRRDLRFAAADVRAVDAALAHVRRGAYRSRTLVDGEATRDAVLGARDFLAAADPADLVVVLLAGHGVVDDAGVYRFATHGFDFDEPGPGDGVTFAELEEVLAGTPSTSRVVFIDSCHAGDATSGGTARVLGSSGAGDVVARGFGDDEEDSAAAERREVESLLVEECFLDLRRGSGATVIAASGSAEFAYEGPEWDHGVFTHALLRGLAVGDLDLDERVTVSELRAFVADEVVALTNGRQRPRLKRENVGFDVELVPPLVPERLGAREDGLELRPGSQVALVGVDRVERHAVLRLSTWRGSLESGDLSHRDVLELRALDDWSLRAALDRPATVAPIDVRWCGSTEDGERIVVAFGDGRVSTIDAPFDSWREVQGAAAGIPTLHEPVLTASGRFLVWPAATAGGVVQRIDVLRVLDLDDGSRRDLSFGGGLTAFGAAAGAHAIDLVVTDWSRTPQVLERLRLDAATGEFDRLELDARPSSVRFLDSGDLLVLDEQFVGPTWTRVVSKLDADSGAVLAEGAAPLPEDRAKGVGSVLAWVDGTSVLVRDHGSSLVAHWTEVDGALVRRWTHDLEGLSGEATFGGAFGRTLPPLVAAGDGSTLLARGAAPRTLRDVTRVFRTEGPAPVGALATSGTTAAGGVAEYGVPILTPRTRRLLSAGPEGDLYEWTVVRPR